ncbi:hypothetical protein PsorP6_007293 [Peronosclerospora sorghi]|uniref:Uncharacterized protein n=1 Tax=Peronosclerospora sorghi TaxID=230839 RepID=A0ACC0W791_9STRA|nr:hypothetical protein PsorP6_007293 [Peronosclerospora sorghi]
MEHKHGRERARSVRKHEDAGAPCEFRRAGTDERGQVDVDSSRIRIPQRLRRRTARGDLALERVVRDASRREIELPVHARLVERRGGPWRKRRRRDRGFRPASRVEKRETRKRFLHEFMVGRVKDGKVHGRDADVIVVVAGRGILVLRFGFRAEALVTFIERMEIAGRGEGAVDDRRGRATVARIEHRGAIELALLAKQLHEHGLGRLALIHERLRAHFQSSNLLGRDVIRCQEARHDTKRERIHVLAVPRHGHAKLAEPERILAPTHAIQRLELVLGDVRRGEVHVHGEDADMPRTSARRHAGERGIFEQWAR